MHDSTEDDPSGVHTGRHRAAHRRRRLAAAAAAATLAIITAVWINTGGEPESSASPAPKSPLWTGVPYEHWSLSTPAPWAEPSGPPPAVPSVPVADPGTGGTPAPDRTPTPAAKPVLPAVSLTAGPIPAFVNLSAEGARDWVHWGLGSATAVNRRPGAGRIEDLGGTPRGRYDNNPQLYSWTGGTPTATASRTPTGVYTCGQGGTIILRAPAGPATRTLRVYAGVWMATGRLTVTVGNASASGTLENRDTISTNRFEIRYRAPAGSKLTVTWTATAVHHPTCGNIDLQAATLS
ncbi:hypothetical protein Ait01nite_047930 [Actinoplanes italicus]|uniref:Uncharacterized protein n=1 Tax=Actinoplanes italicus TaxID=113567 RepID=A0A2T0K9T7_9ACTN|nr:hypothetical protein [Actinoplanes italicus]PRX19895.1 hypothetical protein CLV67_109160 [Actinoplanes italicus]GIE31748.1 hypothetical protein Ait01nite_047930 [Actinoplanes italicus]